MSNYLIDNQRFSQVRIFIKLQKNNRNEEVIYNSMFRNVGIELFSHLQKQLQ